MWAAVVTFFKSLVASLQRMPQWAQQQHLKRLRDQSNEEPQNAKKHAAYLAELNKVNPREVISRVESKEVCTHVHSPQAHPSPTHVYVVARSHALLHTLTWR